MPLMKNDDILLGKRTNKEKEPIIVCQERLSSAINTESERESFSEGENKMYLIEETHTEETITVKREPDDFDNRKTENEVERDLDQKSTIQIHCHIKSEEEDFKNGQYLISHEEKCHADQKSTIQIHSHIKSEEENFINSQYLISHEEVNIKPEEDVEQSPDTEFKNDKVRHKPKDPIVHKCPNCPFQSKRKGDVNRHSVRHKKPDEIEWHRCTECPYKTIQKAHLKSHSVQHKKPDEIEWHRCTECPYKTYRKETLKQHAIVHDETRQNEIFKCVHCVFQTPWKQSLKHHLLVHRGENMPWIHCPESQCSYRTKRQDYLKNHQLKHDKWHACPQCHHKTISKNNLQTHILRPANPDQLELYTCAQCRDETSVKYNLKQHANWLQCTFCSFKTWRKSDFKRHQIKHQDDDSPGWCKCPECPYKTMYTSNLLLHSKYHRASDQTGWLQCPECSYRTSRTNRLKAHQTLHNSVAEWFYCFQCTFKTNWKRSVVTHMKMHRQTVQDQLT